MEIATAYSKPRNDDVFLLVWKISAKFVQNLKSRYYEKSSIIGGGGGGILCLQRC